MKHPTAALACGLFCATALTLSAQTFTEDESGTPGVNTYTHTNDFVVDEIFFNNATGKATNPYSVNPVSLKETTVTTATGTFTVYDICAELFVGVTGDSTYSVTEGFGALNASQQLAVRKLFSNTLSDFITTAGVDYDDASTIGAAIQLAFWEIAEDNFSGVSNASLDEDSPDAGDLSIDGFVTGPPSYSGKTRDAIDLAESYLTNLRNDTWTDQGGINYYFADAGSEQDRLWVSTVAIPEPSTALLGLIGMTFLLRRRRN